MTATSVNWLWWSGAALIIAYDMLIGIPNRVFMAILLMAVSWTLGDLNKRLEASERESVKRFDALTERLDGLNKRLRWVEFKFFGADRDNVLSEEWAARQRAGDQYEP